MKVKFFKKCVAGVLCSLIILSVFVSFPASAQPSPQSKRITISTNNYVVSDMNVRVENGYMGRTEDVIFTGEKGEISWQFEVAGYRIEVVFVLTSDPQINVSRVAQRVKNGGHDVPKDKIVSRYHKSLDNIAKMLKIADVMWVVDNSTEKAELIIYSKDDKISINETALWNFDEINKLISESYY